MGYYRRKVKVTLTEAQAANLLKITELAMNTYRWSVEKGYKNGMYSDVQIKAALRGWDKIREAHEATEEANRQKGISWYERQGGVFE